MAFRTHKGSFSKSTGGAPASQEITGIPFLPKALIIWATTNPTLDTNLAGHQMAMGFTDGTAEQPVFGASETALLPSDTDRRNLDTKLLTFLNFAQGIIAECDFTSFDDNGGGDFGFTIDWTTNNVIAYQIHYLALGGDDLTNAKVGSFNSATAVGGQAVTGVGFEPDAVMFLNSFQTAFGTVAGLSYGLGMAVSPDEQGAVSVASEDGISGSTNTNRYQRTNRCIAMLGDDGVLEAEAQFVTVASGGFTVDWLTANGTARKIAYLALKGGRYSVGAETQKTSTGTKDTPVAFQPTGLLLAGFNNVASASVEAHNQLVIGGASAVGEEGMTWVRDNDAAVAVATGAMVSSASRIIEHRSTVSSTLQADAILDSFAFNKFVLDWQTADATARQFLYFAFGDGDGQKIVKGTFAKATALFPSVLATNTSLEDTGNPTNHTVSLPAGISAGNLLIVVFSCDGAESVGWPAGWTEIFEVSNSIFNTLAVAYRQADGLEGATIIVTTGTGERSAHVSYLIKDHEDPATRAPEISTGATGASINPDPDSLTPTGGAKNYLWLALHGHDVDHATTAIPSSYSNQVSDEGGGSTGTGVGCAERQLNASVENPGTFTITSDQWVAATLVVHPLPAQDIILPFEPKALILWASEQTSEGAVVGGRFTYGFSDGADHYSIGGSTEDAVNPSDADHRHASKALTFINNTPAVLAECEVSFDKRKFTINWTTNNGSAYIIHYLAIGGIDNAKVGVFSGGAGSGEQSITGVGFRPDIVLFASAHVQADPPGNGDDLKMMMGAAISASQRVVVDLIESDDLDALFNSRRMTSEALCLLKLSPTSFSNTTVKEADFVSQDAGGFTIDWTKVNSGNDRFGYLALRGGNYEIGIEDIPTSTGEVTTTLSSVRTPRGVLFFHARQITMEIVEPPSTLAISAVDALREGFAGWSVFDGITTTDSAKFTGTDKAIAYTIAGGTVTDAEADLALLSASSFTLDWTKASTAIGKMVFVAFGTTAPDEQWASTQSLGGQPVRRRPEMIAY